MGIDYAKISKTLDSLLESVDLTGTTEDKVSSDLPDGYFLCEVLEANLGESKAGNAMFSIKYRTFEDGKRNIVDDQGYAQLVDAKGTANKTFYTHYVLSNEMNINFFVSDMLKFQDPETNEPLFDKDMFKDTKGIVEVAELLQQGGIIFIMVQTVEKRNAPGEKEKKYKPISWTRARALELL